MLKIYDPTDNSILHPLNLKPGEWCLTHKYDGEDTVNFSISNKDEMYSLINEETILTDDNNRYLIKNVDEHGSLVTVDCIVDTDDWKVEFHKEFRTTDKYLSEVLDLIKPTGWTVSGAGISTKRATIEASEGNPLENVTSKDILLRAMEVYAVTVNYDVIKKILYVINPSTYTPSGEYFTDELNLRSIGFVGNSDGLATRLYAYGKKDDDGNALTFASINGGKEYVENKEYCRRTICVGWSDERYTVKQSLLDAAKDKLKELAFPARSYECDVVNMNKDMWLYKSVTLIDRHRKTRVEHRCVEYKEYPGANAKDVVTLSATAPKIESSIKQIANDMKQQKEETESFMQEAIGHATELITGENGGNLLIKRGDDGKPQGILIMDTANVNTAKKVWQWNLSGLGYSKNGAAGPYSTAITSDGKIVADFITVGTMLADRIKGGTLSLGGFNNNSGILVMYNGSGSKVGQWDKDGIVNISGDRVAKINNGYFEVVMGGELLGHIGCNRFKTDANYKGLTIDLETDGDYISFASRANSYDDTYTIKMVYNRYAKGDYRADTWSFDCPADFRNNKIYRAWFEGSIVSGGYKGYTGNVRFVVSINGDTYTWNEMQFINGIMVTNFG